MDQNPPYTSSGSRPTSCTLFSPNLRTPSAATALGKRAAYDAGLDGAPASSRRELASSQMREHNFQRQIVKLEQENAKQAAKIEEQRVEIDKLKNDCRTLLEGETKAKNDGEEVETRYRNANNKLSQDLRDLQKKYSSTQNTLQQLQSDQSRLMRQNSVLSGHASAVASLEARLKEVEAEREELKMWKERSSALAIQLEEEKRRGEERRRGIEDENQDREADKKIHAELKRQSTTLSMLGSQNALLRDEVNDLRIKYKSAEAAERAAKIVQKELKNEIRSLQDQLERARHDMDSLTQNFSSSSSSPSSESTATLQNRLSTLSTLHSQTTANLASAESKLRELQDRHSQLVESSAMALSELRKENQEIQRELRWAREGRESAERRERVALKEVDVLRNSQNVSSGSEGHTGDHSLRISQLERLVETYKSELEGISRDSREVEQRLTHGAGLVKLSELEAANERIDQLQRAITSYESTISELTSANTTLDAEVSDLMRRVASGEYNPSKERCLELKANPARKEFAIRSQTLADLKAENVAFLGRLKFVEQSSLGGEVGEGKSDTTSGMVPRESFERILKDKEDMEMAHAKRLMRLKEIFGQKSREFLESVHSLLGWRIKFDESGSDIRLTSMYAPKGKMGLTLKFAPQEGHYGTMQMSGGMARGFEDARQFWVVERQSVPGFLAQVTTEMFEKTTMGRGAGYVGLQ